MGEIVRLVFAGVAGRLLGLAVVAGAIAWLSPPKNLSSNPYLLNEIPLLVVGSFGMIIFLMGFGILVYLGVYRRQVEKP